MRSFSVISVTVLIAAGVAVAAPVSFSDGFEDYLPGSADRYQAPYVTVWPDAVGAANRYPVDTAQKASGAKSILVNNTGYSTNHIGITHELGTEVQGTDANPLVLEFWLRIDSTASRRTVDINVELTKDELIPRTDTAANGLSLSLPYSVRSNANVAAYLFNGQAWTNGGLSLPTANAWHKLTLTVKSNTMDLAIGPNSNSGFARSYLGTFNQINIRHVTSLSGALWLDDLSLTGGEIIPEPATMTLLALGGLLLRRRVR